MRFLTMIVAMVFVFAAMSALPASAQVNDISGLCAQNVDDQVVDINCTNAVDAFILAAQGPDAATQIGDLVTAMAGEPLASQVVCTRLANQVDRLGAASPDEEQAQIIDEVGLTLRDCTVVQTALVVPLPATPI